ncbi:hypothetical protein, partial [Acinetobacter baumannii]|uniref:hypothetical protein n=1 Tax=Acinetobacter baumannii TaxID=470 RepID=UPI001BC86EAA
GLLLFVFGLGVVGFGLFVGLLLFWLVVVGLFLFGGVLGVCVGGLGGCFWLVVFFVVVLVLVGVCVFGFVFVLVVGVCVFFVRVLWLFGCLWCWFCFCG